MRDPETGLDHMWFRYYNSRLARFMSADPLGGSIGDPQSLNRFAYVLNNPGNYFDPLGLDCTKRGDQWYESDGSPCTHFNESVEVRAENDVHRTWGAGQCTSIVMGSYSINCLVLSGNTVRGHRDWFWDLARSFVKNFKLPQKCSEGVFVYGGAEASVGPLLGEVLAIVSWDSVEGGQHGGIVAGGLTDESHHNQMTVGGEWTRTWKNWSEHFTPIALINGSIPSQTHLGPMDFKSKDVGGIFQISKGKVTVGGYVGGTTRGARVVGGGGYITLSATGCTN